MDIPNLADESTSKSNPTPNHAVLFSLPVIAIIIVLAISSGFILSRVFPKNDSVSLLSSPLKTSNQTALSTDSISSTEQLVVGKVYGNLDESFKDTAVGTIEKGSINGEGTHILNREGGATQRASLTSSTVDLDLFVGKKVEIKGQTNTSKKTGWLLDVGNIKILE